MSKPFRDNYFSVDSADLLLMWFYINDELQNDRAKYCDDIRGNLVAEKREMEKELSLRGKYLFLQYLKLNKRTL